jgi:hypothetical protein
MEIWSLTKAATFARLSYAQGLRLVMTGVWQGRQVEGRWQVEAPSVREWKERQVATAAASRRPSHVEV